MRKPSVFVVLITMSLLSSTRLIGAESGDDRVSIQMALFFAPAPLADPLPALRELCARPEFAFHVVDPASDEAHPLPLVWPHWVQIERYGPPTESAWRYRTRGLPAELRPSFAEATRTLVLEFAVARIDAIPANERIARIVASLAETTGGHPWDEEARCLYSRDEWKQRRVDSWSEGIPDLRMHIVIDTYRDGELLRMVSLGMRKFALPDLACTGVTGHVSRALGSTMTAVAQLLAEGRPLASPFDIDLNAVRHEAVRAWLLADPLPGATAKARAMLTPVEAQQGDADNALLALDFASDGASPQERHESATDALFGVKDEVHFPKADPAALKEASAKARARLLTIRKHFDQGFEAGDHLSIKAPFAAPDGRNEYMWVEVTAWTDGTLSGSLVNQPVLVKELRPGSRVQVEVEQVYDYIWTRSDGTTEGNETGRLMEAAEAAP